MSAGDSSAERPPTSGNRNIIGLAPKRIHPAVVWAVALAIVLLGIAIYSRSVHIMPISDDWVFLAAAKAGPNSIYGFTNNYHYNPVARAVMFVVYQWYGLNPVPYHIVDIALFSICVVLVLHLGWKLTNSFTVGALASLLFVLSGREYEAVIWTLIAIFQTLGLVFYLGGLLFYLHAQDSPSIEAGEQRHSRRRWLLVGFYACMVLAVFTYEQEATLVIACMLFRLVVLEQGMGFSGSALRARIRPWVNEFGFPVVFFLAYLLFKLWLSQMTQASQAPGLQLGVKQLISLVTIGLYQSMTPGTLGGISSVIQYHMYNAIQAGQPLLLRLLTFVLVCAPIVLVIVFAKPCYRWLGLWFVLVVSSTVLGIGGVFSRYELLFIVPVVILYAGILRWTGKAANRFIFLLVDNVFMADAEVARRLRRVIPTIAGLLIIGIVVLYGREGIPYTLAQEANWQQASNIQDAALQRISDIAAEHDNVQALYLVNLPDRLTNPASSFETGAFIFLDGPPFLIYLTMPGRFQVVEYVRTPDFAAHQPKIPTERARLDNLSHDPANLVVCFSKQTRQIEVWGPLCT